MTEAPDETFIRAARRDQLVQSAIAVIAELGAARASVVKIARHAGVSRGVATYHFRDADDLADAVVAEVYRLGGEQLREPVATAATPAVALRVFVGGSVDFYAEYPQHIVALHEIFAERRRSATRSRAASPQHGRELSDVADLLRAGQRDGEFRDFDAGVMAGMVRAVLDSAIRRLAEGTDVAMLREETVRTVELMVRKDAR